MEIVKANRVRYSSTGSSMDDCQRDGYSLEGSVRVTRTGPQHWNPEAGAESEMQD